MQKVTNAPTKGAAPCQWVHSTEADIAVAPAAFAVHFVIVFSGRVCRFPRAAACVAGVLSAVGCSLTLDPTVSVEQVSLDDTTIETEVSTDSDVVQVVLATCTVFVSETSEYELCAEPLAWHAAEHDCALRGAALASIASEEENQLVYTNALSVDTNVWLGGSRDDVFVWSWANGDVFWRGGAAGEAAAGAYAKWAPTEPNDTSTVSAEPERCLALTLGGADWNDRACSVVLPYVCERDGGILDAGL